MVTQKEWDVRDNRWRQKKDAAASHNKMLIDRIVGAPSQPVTPESDADQSNPNTK